MIGVYIATVLSNPSHLFHKYETDYIFMSFDKDIIGYYYVIFLCLNFRDGITHMFLIGYFRRVKGV